MTRLADRNHTRRVKLLKKRGFAFMRGSFWKRYGWKIVLGVMPPPPDVAVSQFKNKVASWRNTD